MLGLDEYRCLSTLLSFVMFKFGEHSFLSVLLFSVSTLTNFVSALMLCVKLGPSGQCLGPSEHSYLSTILSFVSVLANSVVRVYKIR